MPHRNCRGNANGNGNANGRGNCRGNANGQQCLADANANRPAGMNAEVSAMETSQLRAFYNYEQYDVKPVVVAAHMTCVLLAVAPPAA